jgi:hypothetical protein
MLFFLWLAALLGWAVALFSRWPVASVGRGTVVCLCLVAVSLIPRMLSLLDLPYFLAYDEVIEPYNGLVALQEHPWEIMSGVASHFSQPYLTSVPQAFLYFLLEPLAAARSASLVQAIVSLLATYALAARLFDRRTATVALTLLACSYWHMVYSRLGYPYMQAMAMVPGTLYVLALGMDYRNRFLLFLGGCLLAASLLMYTPVRIVVPIAGVWIAHRAMTARWGWRETALTGAAIALGMAVTYTPHLHSYGAMDVLGRFHETTLSAPGPLTRLMEGGWEAARTVLAEQVGLALAPYYAGGANMAVGDFSPAPIVDRVTLAIGLLGCGLCMAHLVDSHRCLLVVWIAATFGLGQVLTDVPTSAYRAAPLLPALAIAGGLGVSRLLRAAERWQWPRQVVVRVMGWCALVALVLPPNLHALETYLNQRREGPGTGIGRLIGRGDPDTVYYIVAGLPIADLPMTRFLGPGRQIRDSLSLMDDLGQTIDPHHNAMFVLDPQLTDAAAAIRRCYPSAEHLHEPSGAPALPVIALHVSADAVAAGRNCTASPLGPGLRARYFSGAQWDGTVRLDRVEDWPLCFRHDPAAFGSVEWSGRVRVPVAGTYGFQLYTSADAVAEAHIDGLDTLRNDETHAARLAAGAYPLTIRCRLPAADSFCWLRWRPPAGEIVAIPTQFLQPE